MGYVWDTIALFIGYYGVALETGSIFVTQNNPTGQFDTTPTQSHRNLKTAKSPSSHYHNAPCLLLSPKICLRIVFNLSWDDCCTQEKIGNNGYAKFWGKNRQYYMGTVKRVMLNSIEVLHWCQNSLQCRRFLCARNLPVKAPCWNFPKRGGDGASQRERGGGGKREKKFIFFSPPLPAFLLSPSQLP